MEITEGGSNFMNVDDFCIVGNSCPIQSVPAFLFADARDRSLGAPFPHVEDSTHLSPRKPFTPQRGHSNSINRNIQMQGTSVLYITAIKPGAIRICYVPLFSRPLSPL
jgi:hypothetical protein